MTSPGPFDGYDLAIGSVHGVRQWRVDPLGRLTGVSFRAVWRPGENVAKCDRVRRTDACAANECGVDHGAQRVARYYAQLTWGAAGPAQCSEPDPCGGVDPSCGCGFWAYYDDAQWDDVNIKGVIRGYGKTTVGTKGFRCEKAEIVALCLPQPKARYIPGPPTQPVPSLWDRYSLWCFKHSWTVPLSAVAGCGSLAAIPAAFVFPILSLALAILSLAGWITLRAAHRGIDLHYKPRIAVYTAHEPDVYDGERDERAGLIRRNYPGVQVFHDYKEMLAAFPLTAPEKPSPDQPEFWELPADKDLALPPSHLWKREAAS